MYFHFVARARHGLSPYQDVQACRWAWKRLRVNFPEVLAAVLMPNHLHLICSTTEPADQSSRLTRMLAMSCRGDDSGIWEVGKPQGIPDPLHLARQVRYVVLNPCRARLCGDPLEWPWSTHRGVVGAIVDPWVPAIRLARALEKEGERFRERHHAYVSGDPSVSSKGSPFPRPEPERCTSTVPLEWIARAAAAATESDVSQITRRTPTRRLFIRLAWKQGWRSATLLAERAEISRFGVRRALRISEAGALATGALAAGALCLGDPRLRNGT